ncbi:MAG: hypothetical protein ACOVN9_12270 [Inhella sp.]
MKPWRFAANLDWLYPDRPFLERFDAARADGFTAVELLQPHQYDAGALQLALQVVSDEGGDDTTVDTDCR